MGPKKILYIGYDDGHFVELKSTFKRLWPYENFIFEQIHDLEKALFSSLALKIARIKPDLIYQDFSENLQTQISLAQFLRRSIPFKFIPLIGVLDPEKKKSVRRRILSSGIEALHLKSIEFSAEAQLGKALMEEKSPALPVFATAKKLNEKVVCSILVRIGFITPQYIHIETDIDLKEGDVLYLTTFFSDDFPIQYFKVVRKMTSNLYYHFQFAYDLEYLYDIPNQKDVLGKIIWDEEVPAEPPQDNRKSAKRANFYETYFRANVNSDKDRERKERMQYLLSWFELGTHKSAPKRTRVLVIDKKLGILRQSKKELDEYHCTFNIHAHLDQEFQEIERTKAGIIVYCLENSNGAEEKGEGAKNDWKNLELLMNKIRSISGYSPFVVLFNVPSQIKSQQAQESLKWGPLIADNGPFDLDLVMQYAWAYEQKGGRKKSHDPNLSFHDKEQRIYLDKRLKRSLGSLRINIEVQSFSEFLVTFKSPVELPLEMVLKVSYPFRFFCTIVSYDKGRAEYQALIHTVSESDKSRLRRLVTHFLAKEKFKARDAAEEAQKKNKGWRVS